MVSSVICDELQCNDLTRKNTVLRTAALEYSQEFCYILLSQRRKVRSRFRHSWRRREGRWRGMRKESTSWVSERVASTALAGLKSVDLGERSSFYMA